MEHITDMEKVLAAAKKYVDAAELPNETPADSESFIRRLMRNHPSIDLFRDIQGFLDADCRAIALAAIWPNNQLTNEREPYAEGYCTKEEFVGWLTSCNSEKLMGTVNVKLLAMLPDEITVFRGETGLGDLEPTDAVCWTVDVINAIVTPDNGKFGTYGGGYSACINKEDVFAYFVKSDMEIALNPDKLYNIRHFNNMWEAVTTDEYLLLKEQVLWENEYSNNKLFHDLWEKLEPLGRVNEFVEATMDSEKREVLFHEFFPRGTTE